MNFRRGSEFRKVIEETECRFSCNNRAKGVVHIGVAYRSRGKCMDFEAIMLFTRQVFHWQSYTILLICETYYFKLILSLWYCKSVADKKTCNLHEEITFPHKLIFVFILCFVGGNITKKIWEKRYKGDPPFKGGWVVYRSKVQPFCTLWSKLVRNKTIWSHQIIHNL